jgi:3-oxoacyl-(acyl-carrier-protein) synthase
MVAARCAVEAYPGHTEEIGLVSIGSARGATESLERTFRMFLDTSSRVPVHTSPTTTAGTISSWVAQDLFGRTDLREGIDRVVALDTSMTCSSAFHALLVALGFLRGGLATACLIGGSEACLTPYTVSQLQALGLYGRAAGAWPCQPLSEAPHASNSVVLGEGAGAAILTLDSSEPQEGDLEILGIGWALEETPSATGISADGLAFESSMRMACQGLPSGVTVDAVVTHAPGSVRGDLAEISAIRRILGELPLVTTKHLTGHTYGASGFLGLELARYLLQGGVWLGLPYAAAGSPVGTGSVRAVMVNTAGFGGNSISVIVGTAVNC